LERNAKGIIQLHKHCYTFNWIYAFTFTVHAQMILNPPPVQMVTRL